MLWQIYLKYAKWYKIQILLKILSVSALHCPVFTTLALACILLSKFVSGSNNCIINLALYYTNCSLSSKKNYETLFIKLFTNCFLCLFLCPSILWKCDEICY